MTVSDLLLDVYEDVGLSDTPPASVRTRIAKNLNKGHREILRDRVVTRLRDTVTPLTFVSEASRAVYGLPSSLSAIRAVSERDTDRRLSAMSLVDLRVADPGLSASGTPWAFVPLGYRPYARALASTGVWVASSAAGDTTQVLQVNGIRAGGLPTGDLAGALSGTSRVQVGTVTDLVDLQAVSLSAPATGTVTLYNAAVAGTSVAEIPPGARAPQYFVVQLYPEPGSAITYYVDGTLRIPDLDDAQDVPMLPDEFHDLLSVYAKIKEYEKTDDARLPLAREDYQRGLSQLRNYVAAMPAELPVLGRPHRRAFSRYGGWTPAEIW